MQTIVIGSGPAGLNAAIHSSNANNEVILLEKNEKAGKKLFITGKGRCNVTNNCSPREFINNVATNKQFLFSTINHFTCQDTIKFFEDNQTPLVIERGNRVFPESYHSYDITDALVKKCRKNNVKIQFNEEVLSVSKDNDKFLVKTSKAEYIADFVVIATGGISYPLTGSTGDGYKFASSLNHTIIDPVPALVGIKIKENIPPRLVGEILKNVSLISKSNKFKHIEFGEMSFFENYIDGPIVISTSSLINRITDPIEIELDLKPALNEEQLISRINRDIQNTPNEDVYTLLKGLLPLDFIPFFFNKTKFDSYCKCCSFSKEKRLSLVKYLKHFPLNYDGLLGFERAVVTSGGVSTKEIDSKTMESKIVHHLFFAGEVIDVDAFTGGFNIQIALSTGASCGDYIFEATK